jgi:leucyl-tRNA synthetase
MSTYDHRVIEQKWQKKWKETAQYRTENRVGGKENEYVLVEFPYPSGNLHVGHWYAFAVPDIYARMRRMQGKNVLYPIGFDAFGLPAENAAIKRGLDPREWTEGNMATMMQQLESMGNSFDWSRFIKTCDPEYYTWTQWLFLQLYKKGLAYKKKSTVPWCESCKTVLANEQIVHGTCERCSSEVTQKELDQWFLKITDYAERLLADLDTLDWPEEIKQAQREWIGKSEGGEITFSIGGEQIAKEESVTVFTTRADTLFGVTYIVLAPEHELLDTLKEGIENWDEVSAYRTATAQKKELERKEQKEKTGVEVKGVFAINPANGEQVPVWVADYVLASYGTGAVMAVPAHDERDWEFAEKYGLPMCSVIVPNRNKMLGVGVLLKTKKGTYLFQKRDGNALRHPNKITAFGGGIEKAESIQDCAIREMQEELKISISSEELHYVGVAESHNQPDNYIAMYVVKNVDKNSLSLQEGENIVELTLHEVLENEQATEFTRQVAQRLIDESVFYYTSEGVLTGSTEFSGLSSEEAKTAITTHVGGKLTTQYRLRDWLLSRQRYWGCPIPIVYDPEGKPHAVPDEHLPWLLPQDADVTPTGKAPLATSQELRERTERIFGVGWKPECDTMDTFIDSSWYFLRYLDPRNAKEFASTAAQDAWMPVAFYSGGAEHTTMHLLYSRFFHKALFDMGLVRDSEPYTRRMNRGLILGPDGQKMSKSKGNVVDPGEHVDRVGADTVRMFLAFVGPYNEVGHYPWDLGGIAGVRRFLERIWNMRERVVCPSPYVGGGGEGVLHTLHHTIKKVTADALQHKFNTAISAMMVLVNTLEKEARIAQDTYETLLRLLAPFAPHLTEELWEAMGHTTSIHAEPWPQHDETKLARDTMTIVVQINGKTRGTIEVASGATEEDILVQAKAHDGAARHLAGKTLKKEIYVKGRLVNLVVGGE